MKTILDKVKTKINKGYVLCEVFNCGLRQYEFRRGEEISKYPRLNEESFCDFVFGKVHYRIYGQTTEAEYIQQ